MDGKKTIVLKANHSDGDWARKMQEALYLAKRQCLCQPRQQEQGGQEPGECEVAVCPPCQARGALNAALGALEAHQGA